MQANSAGRQSRRGDPSCQDPQSRADCACSASASGVSPGSAARSENWVVKTQAAPAAHIKRASGMRRHRATISVFVHSRSARPCSWATAGRPHHRFSRQWTSPAEGALPLRRRGAAAAHRAAGRSDRRGFPGLRAAPAVGLYAPTSAARTVTSSSRSIRGRAPRSTFRQSRSAAYGAHLRAARGPYVAALQRSMASMITYASRPYRNSRPGPNGLPTVVARHKLVAGDPVCTVCPGPNADGPVGSSRPGNCSAPGKEPDVKAGSAPSTTAQRVADA